jgi:peptidoglycan-associated lipoprotein
MRTLSLGLWMLGTLAGCANSQPAPRVASAACSDDRACGGGRCVAGVCQACAVDADCGSGRCVANRCEPGRGVAAGERTDEVTLAARDGNSRCLEHIHFDYDDDTLSQQSRDTLARAADCLQREGDTRYVLMGHTDPRGSTEYNLALGERRARRVQRYLVYLGVNEARLGVSSVGAEFATGDDEESWARDRRVEPTQRNASSR